MSNNTVDNRATIIFPICLFLAYIFPFHTYPFPSFYNDFFVIWGLVIVAAFIGCKEKVHIRLPWIVMLPIGLAGVIAVQLMTGLVDVNSDGIFPIGYFLGAAIAIIVGATVTADKSGPTKFCTQLGYAYVLAGLVSVVIAAFQFFAKEGAFAPFMILMAHSPKLAMRPVANIGQTNHLALLLCLSIASIWWLYQVRQLQPTAAICIMLALLCGLVLTQSRIGWIIIPVFALITIFWRGNTEYRKVSIGSILIFFFLYIIMTAALSNIAASLFDLSVSSPTERVGDKSTSERLALFKEAWTISLAHPWFGSGWNSFVTQQLKLDVNTGQSVFASHAHNLVLNFAVELGWPITILVLCVLISWFISTCIRRKISQANGFALLCFVAVLIHSLVEFPLWYAYVLVPLSLLIGMVHYEHFGSAELKISRVNSFVFFLIMSLCLLFAAIDYHRVGRAFQYLGFASMGFKLEGATADKPAFTVFSQFYDYFKFAQIEATENMTLEQIAFMERVSGRFAEMPNLKHMALIYSLNHRPDDAVRTLLKIKQLHRCAYADVYGLWQKQADKKPEIFKEISERLPKPFPSICK